MNHIYGVEKNCVSCGMLLSSDKAVLRLSRTPESFSSGYYCQECDGDRKRRRTKEELKQRVVRATTKYYEKVYTEKEKRSRENGTFGPLFHDER